MFIRISQLRLKPGSGEKEIRSAAARALRIPLAELGRIRLVRRSVDARNKADVHLSLTVDAEIFGKPGQLPAGCSPVPEPPRYVLPEARRGRYRPLVVGLGPGGLFAALTLARMGLEPLVIERGRPVEERARDVERFWETGILDLTSNVQFGEGGAGAFSDGKLTTGIRDPRCRYVLETLYEAGAPEEILYAAKPHIGTDLLRGVVRSIREQIRSLGGEVLFGTMLSELIAENGQVTGAVLLRGQERLEVSCDRVLLAVGHSARDTFRMLYDLGVRMEQKPFSVGLRIEHPREMIDLSQYGARYEGLGAADYKLSEHLSNGRGVYTFCMCPGGRVVAAASEAGGVVTNGMSLHARKDPNSNSAVLVSVGPEDYGASDPLAGVRFQQQWEHAAFRLAEETYRAPAQLLGDFMRAQTSHGPGEVMPSYRPGVTWGDLSMALPDYVTASLRQAIPIFGRRLKGFDRRDAVLTGVESRSSSPLRILRDERCEASLKGLYPCGEGAGYAGGILSAAVDGIRCAEALAAGEENG